MVSIGRYSDDVILTPFKLFSRLLLAVYNLKRVGGLYSYICGNAGSKHTGA